MLTELNERLAQSAVAMARLEKLERTLAAVTAEQRELEASLAELRRQAAAAAELALTRSERAAFIERS